jgi:hypothetical protein
MGVVAKMQAYQITGTAGGRYVPCGPDDEGAEPIETCKGVHSYYGVPPWFDGAEFVRFDAKAQQNVVINLHCVSAKGEDDPNRSWADASPSGQLTMTIMNPQVFGYFTPGTEYRVTIEKIVPTKARPRESA